VSGPSPNGKPPMPKVLKELGVKAIERHERRQATPVIDVTTKDGAWSFGSPYRSEDEDEWVALLFDAFGTRSQATFRTFTNQLAELCSTQWNKEAEAWHPSEDELVAAIQIVRSVRPRSEAEACLAAQMVAVHVMHMKLAAHALNNRWPEPRSCAIAGKLARTYAMQLDTLAKLKGRGSRQRITVRKYSQHEHKQIHLYQGGSENGNQPQEPREPAPDEIETALEPPKCSSLPCPHEGTETLPMSRQEGQEALPASRRRKRRGRSER
jgi:hypothetical protein